MSTDPAAPDTYGSIPPEQRVTLDTTSLRALAHPVRVRLMALLRREGPSTATKLASRLGLNSGATSYHLRQLAKAGLVEEDSERGDARDRWWRSVHRATYFNPYDLPEADRPASAVYFGAIANVYSDHIQRAAADFLSFPEPWQHAADLSDYRFRLAPEESAQLIHELHMVLERYRRADDPTVEAPPTALEVITQIQIMPQMPEPDGDAAKPPDTGALPPAVPPSPTDPEGEPQ